MELKQRTFLPPWLTSESFLLLLAGALTLTYAVVGAHVSPTMFLDSGYGFLVWDSMRRGAPFNFGVTPDPEDISRDAVNFMTWWSPGQYFFPGLVEQFGFSLGSGIIVTCTIFSLLGLAGWYLLYFEFGFGRRTAALAVALIACARFFSLPFNIYNGGEVLLFGAAPWFALMLWKMRNLRWIYIPPILAGMAGLFFLKLSGVLFALAVLAAVVPVPWKPTFPEAARKAAIVGVTAALFGIGLYYGWLSGGQTAASAGEQFRWSGLFQHLASSSVAVFFSSLSLGDALSWIFLHPGRPLLSSLDPINTALAVVSFFGLALVWMGLKKDHLDYRVFVYVAAITYVAFLAVIYLRGGAVQADERHFRPVSLMLLVGIVHVIVRIRSRALRGAFAAMASCLAVYGTVSFAARSADNVQLPIGDRGVRYATATHAALQFMRSIDFVGPDGKKPVVMTPSPEIALDLPNSRVIAIRADFDSEEILRRRVYRGRVPRLYIVIKTSLVESGKADLIMRSFVDYPIEGWRPVNLGSFTAFVQE